MLKLRLNLMNANGPKKFVRYMARSAISDERVIIEVPQSIRVKFKSKWRDGTESLLFTPSEFLERLVALIPAPKFHTTQNSTPHAIMEFLRADNAQEVSTRQADSTH